MDKVIAEAMRAVNRRSSTEGAALVAGDASHGAFIPHMLYRGADAGGFVRPFGARMHLEEPDVQIRRVCLVGKHIYPARIVK